MSSTSVEARPDLLEAFRAGWWVLPLVMAAGLGSVWYLTSGDAPPIYRAEATLAAVPQPSLRNENQVMRAIDILDRGTVVATLSELCTSGAVRRAAAARLGAKLEELVAYEVEADVVPNTHLIRLSVEGPDPELAARFAAALGGATAERAGASYPTFALEPLDEPSVPARPLGRGGRRAYAVAGLLGLALGVAAACGVGLLRMRPMPTAATRGSRAEAEPTP